MWRTLSSFELSAMELGFTPPILCALCCVILQKNRSTLMNDFCQDVTVAILWEILISTIVVGKNPDEGFYRHVGPFHASSINWSANSSVLWYARSGYVILSEHVWSFSTFLSPPHRLYQRGSKSVIFPTSFFPDSEPIFCASSRDYALLLLPSFWLWSG